ncbi:MAG: hypothetical protein ED559_09205 [Phycisphaera sp.]|nr:MAG: hypothetical protein ED559_09205 [Phycisphaera sp.]
MEGVFVHGPKCSRYAGGEMLGVIAFQNSTQPAADTSQTMAGLILLFVVIVIASASLALMLIVRSRFRRDIPGRQRKKRELPDAWQEAGRRLETPPGDEQDPGDDDPDDDDDDDDDGEPTPTVPSSPETAMSI